MAKIMFVEDNRELLESAALVLEASGHKVILANDGREAMDLLQGGQMPDLIVSDISMPHMDGYQFFNAVQEHAKIRVIPFIFLTAYGSDEQQKIGRVLGVDDYLVKPFDPDLFVKSIESRLRRFGQIVDDTRQQESEKLAPVRQAMVHMIAHELRTPLTLISGGSSLLEEDLNSVESVPSIDALKETVTLITSGAARLGRLEQQIVLYSELESGEASKDIDDMALPVDFTDIIDQAIEDVAYLNEVKQINLRKVYLPAPPYEVSGLPDQLVSVVREVLKNAIGFSAPGSEVFLRLEATPEEVYLRVQDQGVGIAADDLDKVWEALYQSNREEQEQQGIGIGLTIVHLVCDAHKASATLESELGKGTTVHIRFRRVTDDK